MQKGDLNAAGDRVPRVDGTRALETEKPSTTSAPPSSSRTTSTLPKRRSVEAVRLRPDLPEAHYVLGVVLWQTRRAPEAAEAFRVALARRPDYADAHYMLGTVLRQIGKPEEALAEFEATLKHDPSSAEAWISIGQMRQRQRDAEGAAAAFAEADRIRKKKADAQAALFAIKTGMQKLQADDVPAAVAQLQEAVRLAARQPAGPLPARARTRAVRRFRRGAPPHGRSATPRTGPGPVRCEVASRLRLRAPWSSSWMRGRIDGHGPPKGGHYRRSFRVHECRARGRALGGHRVRRTRDQPLPARDNRLRRGHVRLRR